jgi:hypothetical protein
MKLTMIGAPATWAGGSNGGNVLNAPPVEANEMLQAGCLPVTKTTGGTFVTVRPGWSKALVLPGQVAGAACWDLHT